MSFGVGETFLIAIPELILWRIGRRVAAVPELFTEGLAVGVGVKLSGPAALFGGNDATDVLIEPAVKTIGVEGGPGIRCLAGRESDQDGYRQCPSRASGRNQRDMDI